MIISHLECKEYKEIYDNFYEIVKIQDEYNKKISCFFIIYTNYLGRMLGRSVDDNMLRFYLYTVNQDIKYSENGSEKYSHINKPFNILYSNMDRNIFNPFTIDEENSIRDDMINNYDRISVELEYFKKKIKKINCSIKTFKISLDVLLGDGNMKIKGKC
jgi:hypothetical protein